MQRSHLLKELVLAATNLLDGDVMHQSVHATVKDRYLFSHGHWAVLRLDKKLIVLASAVNSHRRYRIHIARKLRESFKLTILGHVNL